MKTKRLKTVNLRTSIGVESIDYQFLCVLRARVLATTMDSCPLTISSALIVDEIIGQWGRKHFKKEFS